MASNDASILTTTVSFLGELGVCPLAMPHAIAIIKNKEGALRKGSFINHRPRSELATYLFSLANVKRAPRHERLYFNAMEAYRRETQQVIKRFLDHRLGFADCIAGLDASLAGLIPRLNGEHLAPLRALMLANNETVMREMERRGPPHENSK
jgi:hypothetical protein